MKFIGSKSKENENAESQNEMMKTQLHRIDF
jgi:hypothetical protein